MRINQKILKIMKKSIHQNYSFYLVSIK